MTMLETEQDILKDLYELDDIISQYNFLLACAEECISIPDKYKTDTNLIKECQVKTWAVLEWKDDRCFFYGDSEALLVKGALALLQEIYENRSCEEVAVYHCHLMESEIFSRHFTKVQKDGILHVINKVNLHI